MRAIRHFGWLGIVTTFWAGAASVQGTDLIFEEISRINVASAAIGNNPSAVAWNGSRLFIAGFNASGNAASVGIVEVTNATSPGQINATYGSVFGSFASTPNLRGFTGLDLLGSTLAAAYDSGSAVANGLQTFNIATTNQLWGINARGSSGVAFDPGFGVAQDGSGTAWTTIGSGRRILQDNLTGAAIYTSANGMIINSGTGTNWRDIDFDSQTGDIYSRRSNGIFQGVRSGANSLSAVNVLKASDSAADNVNGQNLTFMNVGFGPNAILFNNRATGSNGQEFMTVIQTMDTSGNLLTNQFEFLSDLVPANGNGYYSFDYDPITRTAAIADFANRNVHIFAVVPEPSTVAFGCISAAAFGLTAWRRRRKPVVS